MLLTVASFLIAACSLAFQPEEATILFAGDAMMHKGQLAAAKQADGSYDFSDYFSAIAEQISQADYAVVNLETPLGGAPYSGYPCFCAPDVYADALAEAGFDLFLTANNHTLDRRDRGLKRTVDVLASRGFDHIGTYRDHAQRDSILPLIRDIKGFRVGFLNYTYGSNGIQIQGDAVVDYIDRSLISSDIRAAREAGAEIVCVAIHWGNEYQLLPHSTQKSLANFLISEGVDIVMGGHPHVIQPMEMRTGSDSIPRLLVYSLGNFISDMHTRDTRGGAMISVTLSRDSDGRAIVKDAAYDLIFTVPPSAGRNFRLVYADSCDSPSWRQACNAFAKTARDIFSKHNINVPERAKPSDKDSE